MSGTPSFAEIPYVAPAPLFVNEKECARLLNISETSWPSIRRKWESRGFPKPNAETKKYLWPAVKAWVFADNGFRASIPSQPDGEEDWNE